MRTVSLSLDEETAEDIETLAKQSKVSKGDIIRSLYDRVQLEKSLEELQVKAIPLLERLGLYTEDDIAVYARSKLRVASDTGFCIAATLKGGLAETT